MSALSVGKRIYLGFAVVLAALALVAFLGISSLKDSSAGFGRYEGITAQMLRMTTIERNVVGLRRNVFAYVYTGDEKALARAKELQASIDAGLKDFVPRILIPEVRAKAEKVQADFNGYSANFGVLQELRVKRDRLVNDEMNPLGQKIRQNLSEIIRTAMTDRDFEAAALAGVTQESLLLMRLNVMRFLSSPDPKLIETANKQFEAFEASVKGLEKRLQNPTRQKLAVEADAAADKYKIAYAAAMAAIQERNKLANETMAAQAVEIAKGANDILDTQRKGQAKTKADTEAHAQSDITQAMLIAVVAILFGIVFSFLIASGIVGPVNAMNAAMRRLAGGDKTITVPALEHKDEIGEMAKRAGLGNSDRGLSGFPA